MTCSDPVDRGGRRDSRVDPERHEPEPVSSDAGGREVGHRRLARAHNDVGVALDAFETAAHHAHAVPGERLGGADERQIVHGDDEWRPCRRRHERGGVAHVDGSRRALDRRPSEPQPALVQPGPGERERGHRERRAPRLGRWPAVPAGDADQLDRGVADQVLRDPQGGNGGATGYVVPALLERVGDAHGVGHRPMMAAPA